MEKLILMMHTGFLKFFLPKKRRKTKRRKQKETERGMTIT